MWYAHSNILIEKYTDGFTRHLKMAPGIPSLQGTLQLHSKFTNQPQFNPGVSLTLPHSERTSSKALFRVLLINPLTLVNLILPIFLFSMAYSLC